MTLTRPLHVAVVNSHPIQYFAPLYAYLNRDPALKVTALYCSDFSLRDSVDPGFQQPVTWDIDLLQGYPYVFVGRCMERRAPRGFWSLVCPRLWSAIRGGQYDAVILHGHNYAANIVAFAAAASKRVPVLMRSDARLGLRRPGWQRQLHGRTLSFAYRLVDAFLAVGAANREYYRSLGIPAHKIFDVPLAVDNARFIANARHRPEMKRKWGLAPDVPVILFAGKLARSKRPHDLLRAFAEVLRTGHRATLFFVGSGEMEDELRSLAAGLPEWAVVFGGFVNQLELPHAYAAADVFVLPAERESWGLAVNEAMCAALPIVVSDQVGCAVDLVKPGVNGYVVPTGDIGALGEALVHLLLDVEARERMGAASRSIVTAFSYEACRKGISAALAAVVPPKRAGERVPHASPIG